MISMTQPLAPVPGAFDGPVVADDELLTGEAVVLDVRPAGFILRSAGGAIDYLTYAVPFVLLFLLYSVALPGTSIDQAAATALSVATLVVCLVVAPVVVEVASGGRSLGRLVIGARIVRDDGGAASLRHAMVRSLTGFIEIFVTFGTLAFIASMLNSRSKRIGDLLAGTYSQHERVPRPLPFAVAVPPELLSWAAIADVAKLPDRLSRRIAQFLRQADRMMPAVRERMALELAREAAPFVSPLPAVHPQTFLVAVAALRRDREYRALTLEQQRLARLDPILRGLPHGFPDR
jgi:uncharacterized RDD family membrane protein YckC